MVNPVTMMTIELPLWLLVKSSFEGLVAMRLYYQVDFTWLNIIGGLHLVGRDPTPVVSEIH